MARAICKDCGIVYEFKTETVPKSVKCTCEGSDFKILK